MADKEIPKAYYNETSEQKIKIKSKWWEQDEHEIHAHVFAVVRAIRERQSYRDAEYLRHARLYANQEILGLLAHQFNRQAMPGSLQNRMTYNVIKACIDTLLSKIGTQKPRPLFLTEGGNWSNKRQAQYLTQYMDGWFEEQEVYYDAGPMSFRDGAIFGTGGVKLLPNAEKSAIKCEKVFMPEIVVDDVEGMYGKPRQLHQVKTMFREVVKSWFPTKADREKRRMIDSAKSHIEPQAGDSNTSADMIEVVESWHLPSGPGAKDGKRVLSIENCTLHAEGWDKPYFPFVFRRYSPRILGFYGQGLAEELTGIQLEINKYLLRIQEAFHLLCTPQVWLEYASKAIKQEIDNRIGGIKYYQGRPPVFVSPNAFPAEVYNHLENMVRKAFEMSGVSLLSATSQKPTGVTASVALETLQDVETERFALTEEHNNQFYMRIADMVIDMTGELAKENPDLSVKARDRSYMRRIKWSDVKMDKDSYIMRRYPTNLLPSQPAGKYQRIVDMMQTGMLDKQDAYALMDYPDLKQVTKLNIAPREIVMKTIEQILDGKEYDAPTPAYDLEFAKKTAQLAHLDAKLEGAPEAILQKLLDFQSDIQDLIDLATTPALPAPDAGLLPNAAPMAEPLPLPESELLPMNPDAAAPLPAQ